MVCVSRSLEPVRAPGSRSRFVEYIVEGLRRLSTLSCGLLYSESPVITVIVYSLKAACIR